MEFLNDSKDNKRQLKGTIPLMDRVGIVPFLSIKNVGLEKFFSPGSLVLEQFMKNDGWFTSWQAVQMANLICILETSLNCILTWCH